MIWLSTAEWAKPETIDASGGFISAVAAIRFPFRSCTLNCVRVIPLISSRQALMICDVSILFSFFFCTADLRSGRISSAQAALVQSVTGMAVHVKEQCRYIPHCSILLNHFAFASPLRSSKRSGLFQIVSSVSSSKMWIFLVSKVKVISLPGRILVSGSTRAVTALPTTSKYRKTSAPSSS